MLYKSLRIQESRILFYLFSGIFHLKNSYVGHKRLKTQRLRLKTALFQFTQGGSGEATPGTAGSLRTGLGLLLLSLRHLSSELGHQRAG